MFLIAFVLLSIALVPLFGGQLAAFGRLEIRGLWLAGAALTIQIMVISVFPGSPGPGREAVYVASYLLGVGFLWANRRIPGLPLIGIGAGMNLLAILANGGVMPAAPAAPAAAGLPVHVSVFSNSVVVSGARLAFLGDVFAIPASWPLHNVFSAGDVCIGLGAVAAIHRLANSRLFPSGSGQFLLLLKRPAFLRLWSAQAVSNMGDWMYAIAVATTLAERTRSVAVLAVLLMVQAGSAAVFGALLGPLADRYSRRGLMVGADGARAVGLLTLLIAPTSTPFFYFLAMWLGLFGSIFQPSLQASVPNLVSEGELVTANSLISSTFHFALVAGPGMGGFLVARFGPRPVFALNAASFVISALLLSALRVPRLEGVPPGARPAIMTDLKEGLSFTARTPIVRGVVVVTGLVMLGAATKAPLESLFVLRTLARGPGALGLLGGTWGIGMLTGAVSAPALARRWPHERLLSGSILVTGLAVLSVSRAHNLSMILLAWILAGMANAVGNVSYTSLLQQRTPDEMRGRVFAAAEAALDAAYVGGGAMAAWVGGHFGIRPAYEVAGARDASRRGPLSAVGQGADMAAAKDVARTASGAAADRGRDGRSRLLGLKPPSGPRSDPGPSWSPPRGRRGRLRQRKFESWRGHRRTARQLRTGTDVSARCPSYRGGRTSEERRTSWASRRRGR